jgi:hypothetical protein
MFEHPLEKEKLSFLREKHILKITFYVRTILRKHGMKSDCTEVLLTKILVLFLNRILQR